MVELSGVLTNDLGVAIDTAANTVAVFATSVAADEGTGTGSATALTETNSLGLWAFSALAENKYDVRITNGTSIRWRRYSDEVQVTEIETAVLKMRNPADTFVYDLLPAAITANRTLTLPLTTATRTLVANDTALADSENLLLGTGGDATIDYDGSNLVISPAVVGSGDVSIVGGSIEFGDNEGVRLGGGQDSTLIYDGTDTVWNLTAVGTGDLVINGGSVEFDDSEGITLGTGKDATLRYDGTDTVLNLTAVGSGDLVVNGGSAEFDDVEGVRFGTGKDTEIRWSTGDADNHTLTIGIGDTNQGLHVTDLAAIATDWNIAATTHPNLYLHSNTTPATDYLRLGDHDGTTAYIDVVGGTTLAFEIDGTTEMSMGNNTLTGAVVGTGASQVAAGNHTHTVAVATGSYTGDGTESQEIGSLPFDPKVVWITSRLTSEANVGTRDVLWSSDVIVDDIAAGAAFDMDNSSGVTAILDSAIIALGTTSFTVDDNAQDLDPNANTVTYNYIIWG